MLLKNNGGVLPIVKRVSEIVLLELAGADTPDFRGGGSCHLQPTRDDDKYG